MRPQNAKLHPLQGVTTSLNTKNIQIAKSLLSYYPVKYVIAYAVIAYQRGCIPDGYVRSAYSQYTCTPYAIYFPLPILEESNRSLSKCNILILNLFFNYSLEVRNERFVKSVNTIIIILSIFIRTF